MPDTFINNLESSFSSLDQGSTCYATTTSKSILVSLCKPFYCSLPSLLEQSGKGKVPRIKDTGGTYPKFYVSLCKYAILSLAHQ